MSNLHPYIEDADQLAELIERERVDLVVGADCMYNPGGVAAVVAKPSTPPSLKKRAAPFSFSRFQHKI